MTGGYRELENKYGVGGAYQCLIEIEKAAKIPLWTVDGWDCEARLANAISIQDAANDNNTQMLH